MRIYQVGLVGCGVMGEVHISQIYYQENVKIKYVCDLDMKKAEQFQRKYNAETVVSDYRQITEDEKIDIVIIATQPSTHLKMVESCLQHGKHVLCEKPITNSMEDAEYFYKLTKLYPKSKVLIGNILRHNKSYQKIAEMIQKDAIGHPIICRMIQNHHTMNWETYLRNIKDCAPLVNCGIHYVDILQWFSEEKVEEIHAIGSRTSEEVPEGCYNYGLMTLRLSNGSVAFYEAGWSNTCSAENTKEFIGPKGRIRLVYQKDRMTHAEEGDLIEYYQYPEKEYHIINMPSNRKPADVQFNYLIKMIETGCEAKPTMEEVMDCMQICFEADKQARKCAAR